MIPRQYQQEVVTTIDKFLLNEIINNQNKQKESAYIEIDQTEKNDFIPNRIIFQIEEALKSLNMINEPINKSSIITQAKEQKNKYNITIKLFSMNEICHIMMDIEITTVKFQCQSYITKNNMTPLYASSKNQINILSFFALKKNEKIISGAFCIDPVSGLFMYKTESDIQGMPCKEEFFNIIMQQAKKQHQDAMNQILPTVLFITNRINKEKYNELKKEVEDLTQSNKKQKIELNEDQIDDLIRNSSNKMQDNEIQKYKSIIPKPKPLPILQEIQLPQEKQIKLAELITQENQQAQGGFSNINRVQITYKVKNDKSNLFLSRYLALKTNKNENMNNNKISHELKILSNLQAKKNDNNDPFLGSSFIVPSYQIKNEEYKNCYFMEFYQKSSLERYLHEKNIVISLRTKLFILAGVIGGLEYMHKCEIVHFDIKLSNILLQQQLIPKICDFGESLQFEQLNNVQKKDIFRSMPFAAPELYNNKPLTKQFDIFSYGVLMCYVIFEQYPFEFNQIDLTHLEKRYQDGEYAIKRSLQDQLKSGPKELMQQIFSLIKKCLHPDASKRPEAQWIIVILWKMIFYIDSF